MKEIPISTEFITLDAFLKWVGVAESGGHAKTLISEGQIQVNGEPEIRRGRKLRPGDAVRLNGGPEWLIAQERGR